MSDVFSCHITGVDTVELVLVGELDAFTAPKLREAVRNAPGPIARLDCRAVTFISAAGITGLLQVCGNAPVPVDASPVVRRLIELVGLEHHFQVGSAC